MKNFSPLCSIVMLENLKTSTVNFIISHPGLSYIFVQEVNQFSFTVLLITFTKTVISHDMWDASLEHIDCNACVK